MTPRVTVLMSVYNGERYLKAAIDSILNQSFRDFEFLIIEDCSTDQSANIIQTYGDERIRMVSNEVNLGLTKSLNRGLDIARGAYVARMDADDIALPDRLKLQVDFMENNPEYGMVGARRQILLGERLINRSEELFSDHESLCVLQLFRCGFVHSSVMMRTQLAREVRYNEDFFAAQDYDLWVRLSRRAKIANLPVALIQYRIHPDSISETRFQKQLETVQHIHLEQLSRLGISHNQIETESHLLVGLTMTGQVVGEQELLNAAKWLTKLLHHGASKQLFSVLAWNYTIQYLWRGMFNRKNSKVPLLYLLKNWRHPLNQGLTTKAIIFLNCIKHFPLVRYVYLWWKNIR